MLQFKKPYKVSRCELRWTNEYIKYLNGQDVCWKEVVVSFDGNFDHIYYQSLLNKICTDAYGLPCNKEQSSFTEYCERMRDMQKGDVSKAKKGNWSNDSSADDDSSDDDSSDEEWTNTRGFCRWSGMRFQAANES